MKILALIFLPAIAHCQVIKGDIINKRTKEKVPFATVGLMKENTGINADEEGRFSLLSTKHDRDTLIISSVGYETSKFPVEEVLSNTQFEISEKPIALRPVIVNNNYKAAVTLNDFSNCGFNSYTSSGSVTQVAQHFRSPVENTLLSEIDICKRNDNSLFRIRIYDMDPVKGTPSTDLADTIIEIKSGKKHAHIDLEPYNIIIPGKDFFIAIEWLYIPYNAEKVKVKMNGETTTRFWYNPDLFFKSHTSNDPGGETYLKNWQLDYRGKWLPLNPNWVMLISAKVKY
jgi:hypothetical protein